MPEVIALVKAKPAQITYGTPLSVERLNAMVASEVARWAKVIKEAGIAQE